MRILVAEDQHPSALLLRHMLEQMGHDAVITTDGAEAWRILDDEGEFRIVISDWMMPQMDGLELCRRIRARPLGRYIYVILLTSKNRLEDRLQGLRAGADDFLIKPVVAAELEVRLEIARRILGVHEELLHQNALLAELSAIDDLTGLKNRRRFREDLELHCSFSARHELPLSLVMLDVDYFKQYNDRFGHPAGDDLLRSFAELLRTTIREQDVAARYGGEEFAVLLPNTVAEPAVAQANRLCSVIASHPWPCRPVTASLGVVTTTTAIRGPDDLIEQADRALYHSKRTGRNRVTHIRWMDGRDGPDPNLPLRGDPPSSRTTLQYL
jgi:two-component system cell cycle response regulator